MRYHNLFTHKKKHNELAYIPFLLLGDPSTEHSLQLIDTLVKSGADALELGFAFSDPVADGPVIQQASLRPLANGFTVLDGLKLIKKVRETYPNLPIGLLTYANLIFAQGIDNFYALAKSHGLDSVLIADCPVQESELFASAARKYAIEMVFIAPPDADPETLQMIASKSQGYTYVLSRKGITGTEVAASQASSGFIQALKDLGSAPLVQGFGISEPNHVYQAAAAGVDGIITGSAIVKLINQHYNNPDIMLEKVAEYAQSMAYAAHQAHNINQSALSGQSKGNDNVYSGKDQESTARYGATS